MRRVLAVAIALFACSSPRPPVDSAGSPKPPRRTAAPHALASSRLAVIGNGAVVIDADSGELVHVNADRVPIARVVIGRDAGTLAHHPERGEVYVADRRGDRIVVVELATMQVRATWPTPAEPLAIALTPASELLLVTTIADRALVAYATDTGREVWRTSLSPEPRAIAVDPDGRRALIVGAAGTLDDVDLTTHTVGREPIALDCDRCADGEGFARGGAALFLDAQRAIATVQRMVPATFGANRIRYGGGRGPETQHLAFLSYTPAIEQVLAQIVANQPRSLLWDAPTDTLWIAGHASDTMLRLRGVTSGTTDEVEGNSLQFSLGTREHCGPESLAQVPTGDLWVWCSFSRTIVRIPELVSGQMNRIDESAAVTASTMTPAQHQGHVLFHRVRPRDEYDDDVLACSSCHLDGRADGLSWKIGDTALQTPVLAGRLHGTAPYKWRGLDADLGVTIQRTALRIGSEPFADDELGALVAYLESLPAPRPPTLEAEAVTRGEGLFEAADCSSCHDGPMRTDGLPHSLISPLPLVDTPSLVGIAASAPYYHDGSAPTLDALLRGEGSVHDMVDPTRFTADDRADLVAFLSSL